VDDTEILMADDEVLKAFARYERVYGKGDRPPNGTEPTSEQLSAVKHLLDSNCCPYTDFPVFGPYGQRIYKKVKLSGYQIARDGQLTSVELHGPSNIAQWIGYYNVLQNILVMLDAVDLGHLLRYKTMIERFHDKYGEKVWSVIYQGDVRCRLENMPRIKRIAQAAHDKTTSTGSTTNYDPARPWNHMWLKATEDLEFWREEVVDPSFIIITKIANNDEIVHGDEPTNSAKGGPTNNKLENLLSQEHEFRKEDSWVYAHDMMQDLKQSKDRLDQLESQLKRLTQRTEDATHILEGMEIALGS
jgi:hypothetical protein